MSRATLAASSPAGDMATASSTENGLSAQHGSATGSRPAKGVRLLRAGDLERHFTVRNRINVTEKLQLMLGARYRYSDSMMLPTAGLAYNFGPNLRLEATEERLFVKRRWDFKAGPVSGRVSAEAGYQIKPERRPTMSLGLDFLRPLPLFLGGIGAVVLSNAPVSLTDKELELPLVGSRLRGFLRGSLTKVGHLAYEAHLTEASTILDL